MQSFHSRLIRLIFGLFLYALGIDFTINAAIGYEPWDVLHSGIAQHIGWTIGSASIGIGFLAGIAALLLGEKIGLGTFLNMFLIGLFMDLILRLNILPLSTGIFSGLFMLTLGLFIIALASYFYIGSGFGAGPRDSLMVAIRRRLGIPIGAARILIEASATLIGWALGGQFGFGTLLSAVMIGFCIEIVFRLLHFDPTVIEHDTFF